MNVDIMITGFTHQLEAYRQEGRFYLNPGSATGAWSLDTPLSVSENDASEKLHDSKPTQNGGEKEGSQSTPPTTTDHDNLDVPLRKEQPTSIGSTPSFARMYSGHAHSSSRYPRIRRRYLYLSTYRR